MSKVNLNDIEEDNVLEEQTQESFTSKVRRFDKEEPVKKKKNYTPGPKKKRPETKVKTYNLDLEVIEKVVEKSEEMGITASVFVNKVLRKELGI